VRRRAIRGALLVGLLAVVSAGIASAAGQMDFSDPLGDAGSAPDITAVTVSNDDSGVITFRLTIANRTAIGPDDVVAVQIGTDDPDFFAGLRSDGTGYVLAIDSQGPYLLKWTGSDLPEVKPPPKSLTGSFSGNVATISIKQEDLAPGFPDMSLPVELRFNAVGVLFQGIVATAEDFAPALDSKWSYRLVEPARMVVTNFDADKTIKAGKQLVVLPGSARRQGVERSGEVRDAESHLADNRTKDHDLQRLVLFQGPEGDEGQDDSRLDVCDRSRCHAEEDVHDEGPLTHR
jgi:hypothetical protein